jgi:bifunctional UDP-N-acetylglucosamine pyrophosphorylase / glucosamine-1-phosphate N-acetyltransferase
VSQAENDNRRLAVVILAAGKGTRLNSKRPKVLHEIGGRPMVAHVIEAARRLVTAEHIYVVVGHQAERVRAALSATGVRFVDQPEQRGTGHAIQCVRTAVAGYEHLLVLSGDVPLIRHETIERMWEFHSEHRAAMTILSALVEDPFGYGRVVHAAGGSEEVIAIVEQKSLAAGQESIREINCGIYAFRTSALLTHLDQMTDANSQGEFYLTDMAAILNAAGEPVLARAAEDATEVLGANTIAELVALDAAMRAATAERLMAAGVTIFRPETSMIDASVEVAPDTVIEPFVQLRGQTRVGPECSIRSFTVIENCTLGQGVEILPGSMLEGSVVRDGARIGPFSHLRPDSDVGENAHIGNFVELKKARIGKGSKANHLTYLGDAEIGDGSNIGAGAITCNYDGAKKNRTRIGNNVFVGSDATLVAPLTLEDGSYIGAGSCITKDVPADALAVGRGRQVIKEKWAAARRAKYADTDGQT